MSSCTKCLRIFKPLVTSTHKVDQRESVGSFSYSEIYILSLKGLEKVVAANPAITDAQHKSPGNFKNKWISFNDCKMVHF